MGVDSAAQQIKVVGVVECECPRSRSVPDRGDGCAAAQPEGRAVPPSPSACGGFAKAWRAREKRGQKLTERALHRVPRNTATGVAAVISIRELREPGSQE